MKRKDGEVRSDYDFQLDEIIFDIFFEKNSLTIDKIRNIINDRYKRKLGWITIKRHFDYLEKNKKIKLYYENKEGKKKLRVYILVK